MNDPRIREALAFVALAAVLLAGCAATVEPAAAPPVVQLTPTPAATATPSPEPVALAPITIAAVGDSITEWSSAGSTNWTTVLADGPVVLDPAQGWAVGGTKLAEQAANVTPITADVLVVMGGTNDMGTPRWATPMGERLASLDMIVANAQPARVLILASAPRSYDGQLPGDPAWVTEWATEAAALAAVRGWDFLDPWVDVRAADGTWADPRFTIEGVHPTPEASALVAAQVAAKVEAMFGR